MCRCLLSRIILLWMRWDAPQLNGAYAMLDKMSKVRTEAIWDGLVTNVYNWDKIEKIWCWCVGPTADGYVDAWGHIWWIEHSTQHWWNIVMVANKKLLRAMVVLFVIRILQYECCENSCNMGICTGEDIMHASKAAQHLGSYRKICAQYSDLLCYTL